MIRQRKIRFDEYLRGELTLTLAFAMFAALLLSLVIVPLSRAQQPGQRRHESRNRLDDWQNRAQLHSPAYPQGAGGFAASSPDRLHRCEGIHHPVGPEFMAPPSWQVRRAA